MPIHTVNGFWYTPSIHFAKEICSTFYQFSAQNKQKSTQQEHTLCTHTHTNTHSHGHRSLMSYTHSLFIPAFAYGILIRCVPIDFRSTNRLSVFLSLSRSLALSSWLRSLVHGFDDITAPLIETDLLVGITKRQIEVSRLLYLYLARALRGAGDGMATPTRCAYMKPALAFSLSRTL